MVFAIAIAGHRNKLLVLSRKYRDISRRLSRPRRP